MSSTTTDITITAIYEPTFNPIYNKFMDKTTQELNMCYSSHGCVCPCKDFKPKKNNKKNEHKIFTKMYDLKRHLNTTTHKLWLEIYNMEYDTKDICDKSLNEVKSLYFDLKKTNRKNIADMKLYYYDLIKKTEEECNEKLKKNNEKIISMYEEKLSNKDDTIDLLTKQLKELNYISMI